MRWCWTFGDRPLLHNQSAMEAWCPVGTWGSVVQNCCRCFISGWWPACSSTLWGLCWGGGGTNKRNIHLLCGGAEATVSEQRTPSRLRLITDAHHQKRSTFSNNLGLIKFHLSISIYKAVPDLLSNFIEKSCQA